MAGLTCECDGPRPTPSNRWRLRWKFAAIAGLVTVPLTVRRYAPAESDLDLTLVVVSGILAGMLAKRRGLSASPTGLIAGLIAAFPALVLVPEFESPLAVLRGAPLWSGLGTVLVAGFLLTVLLLSAIVGFLGGRLGGWFVEWIRVASRLDED